MTLKNIYGRLIIFSILMVQLFISGTVSNTHCNASEGVYFEIHIDWYISVNIDDREMLVEATNYDLYDLNLNMIQLDNVTVFEGDFLISGNETVQLNIENLPDALVEEENLTCDLYIKDASMEPAYQADISLNNITGSLLGDHSSYGAFILKQHNTTSRIPEWIEEGKEMEYNVITTELMGISNYTLRTAITEYFPDNQTMIFAMQRDGPEGVSTQRLRMSVHYPYLISWLNPSHIQIIQERATSFTGTLYSYEGDEAITIPLGEFSVHKIRTTQPYFADGIDGTIWVEKETGLILKNNIQYVGRSTDNITLIDTNVFQDQKTGIPGFSPVPTTIGIIILITVLLIRGNNKSTLTR